MPVPRYKLKDPLPVLSAGFRPFFLAAGVWACVAMVVWLLNLRGLLQLPTEFDPVTWHSHELLFGFITAAIAGFLLTAIPNWTGRLPIEGAPLGALFGLWFVGRVAATISAWIGPVSAAIIDVTFLFSLSAVAGREIIAGHNWRNLPVVLAVALLGCANAAVHAGALGSATVAEIGLRSGLAIVVMMIALIGGRIIPSFTTNWLRRQSAGKHPAPFGLFDKITLVLSGLVLAGWVATSTPIIGIGLLVLALLHLIRLIRWRGHATAREPLLLILHIGYGWLPFGFLLLGLSEWAPSIRTSAIHALTTGAMSVMVLAVMTRASLGHSSRELTADVGTTTAYTFVFFAAILRVSAPFLPIDYSVLLEVAGALWIIGFGLFIILYSPLYLRR